MDDVAPTNSLKVKQRKLMLQKTSFSEGEEKSAKEKEAKKERDSKIEDDMYRERAK